jgi:hypothetical protein
LLYDGSNDYPYGGGVVAVTKRQTVPTVLADIETALERLYTAHGFRDDTGSLQVRYRDTETVLAYGQVMALEWLRDKITERGN